MVKGADCIVGWRSDDTVVGRHNQVPVSCRELEGTLLEVIRKQATGEELGWFETAIVLDAIASGANVDSFRGML
ncbi:MAG TPA: hypothetical protein VIY48_18110 [Candidatus Paceibacterota bacterium]